MAYYLYFIAFLLDLAITLAANKYTISFMRVLFYATQFTHESGYHVALAGLLLMTESFIVYGISEADLIIILPLMLIIGYANKKLAVSRLLTVFIVLLCVLLHYLIIDSWLFLKHIPMAVLLTNFTFYGIVIYVILRSSIRGNQDNRLMG